jgi:putative FmdB family regulatory protein
MPTYEYECKNCGHNFEAFQSMSEEALKECPECGKELRRIINGGSGVIFKGSGFYVTDKAKSTAKTASSGESRPKGAEGSGKPEAKSAGNGGAEKSPACASCPAATSSGSSCPAASTSKPEKAAG